MKKWTNITVGCAHCTFITNAHGRKKSMAASVSAVLLVGMCPADVIVTCKAVIKMAARFILGNIIIAVTTLSLQMDRVGNDGAFIVVSGTHCPPLRDVPFHCQCFHFFDLFIVKFSMCRHQEESMAKRHISLARDHPPCYVGDRHFQIRSLTVSAFPISFVFN